jgi:hypothetical protein
MCPIYKQLSSYALWKTKSSLLLRRIESWLSSNWQDMFSNDITAIYVGPIKVCFPSSGTTHGAEEVYFAGPQLSMRPESNGDIGNVRNR